MFQATIRQATAMKMKPMQATSRGSERRSINAGQRTEDELRRGDPR